MSAFENIDPTNIKTGRVTNVNAIMQDHLDQGGRLELVVQRDGKTVLDFLPSEALIAKLKSELEGK